MTHDAPRRPHRRGPHRRASATLQRPRARLRRDGADAARAGGRAACRPAARRDDRRRSARRRSRARLNGGRHAREHGGQGWTMLEWFLVNEQFGRVTNGLHWHVPNAYNVLCGGHPRADRALPAPGARGRPRAATPTRSPRPRRGRTRRASPRPPAAPPPAGSINGEKWFVTSADVAAVLIVMALASTAPTAADAVPRRARRPGRRVRRRPAVHAQLPARAPDDPLHATSRSQPTR